MEITWLGHSAFKLRFGSASVLIDPFLNGNPAFKGEFDSVIAGTTHILLTHGHGDHLGDTVAIAAATGAGIVADADLAGYLRSKGAQNVDEMNSGGTISKEGFSLTMTHAVHSSGSLVDGVANALGQAHGLIVTPENGPKVYHMGDTDIFTDMGLINELYAPEIGIVPIGDRYTMGPRAAALACRKFFDFKHIIPAHYATFGGLPGRVEDFATELGDLSDRLRVLESGVVASF